MADVKCRVCKGIYLQTTDKFRSNVRPNGAMFKAVARYYDWSYFPFHDGSTGGDLVCPACDHVLLDSVGRVKAEGEWCDECGLEMQEGHECGQDDVTLVAAQLEPDQEQSPIASAEVDLDAEVVRMNMDGVKHSDIGKALGITRQKVGGILRRLENEQ